MLQEYITLIIGIIHIYIYKFFYFKRIIVQAIPKINNNFKIAIKKNSKLIIGKNFRARNNMSFRIYNGGITIIGNNCFFNDNCSINCQKNIKIGNNLLCGQNVMIFDHDHDYKNNINEFIRDDVVIGNNVWIGANSIILKGVKIGNNVVIAAGTIVRENVEDNTLVYQQRNNRNKKINI